MTSHHATPDVVSSDTGERHRDGPTESPDPAADRDPGSSAGLGENILISLVVDVHDAEAVGQFWADILGWRIVERGDYGVSIGIENGPCEIDFRVVPEGPKTSKNRIHLDLTPVHRDLAAERDRLLWLGAHEVDVGQGQRRWYVLADPEGNEFCLCPAPTRRIISAAGLPRPVDE